MTKYSTGSSGGNDDGDACELCGRETGSLGRANVAGAELLVCSNCKPHDDTEQKRSSSERRGDGQNEDVSRKKRAAQKQAQVYDAAQSDTSHWEQEGTDYEEDRLPYLISDYGDELETARQEAGLTIEELADELEVDEDDLLAIEQGRASRAGVGGSVVRALEERFDVTLVDE